MVVGGIGVGHLEDRGHAPQDRRSGAGREVFLVDEPRLAKVHLGVDHAGQDVQAPRLEHLVGRSPGKRTHGDDSPAACSDVAECRARRPHAGPAPDQQIEALRQVVWLLCVPIGFVMN